MYTSFFHLNLLDFMNIHKKKVMFLNTQKRKKKTHCFFPAATHATGAGQLQPRFWDL